MKLLLILLPIFLVTSCYKGIKVDLVIHNARIHTLDENNIIAEAMAIKDGKIVELGPEQQILNRYRAEEEIDAQGKDIYPGFTDAHCHVLSLAEQKLGVDLMGTRSQEELLMRLEKYQQKNNRTFIVGHSWDQSLWSDKSMPTHEKLNELFPGVPVCLFRIDGHSALVNEVLLQKANINSDTQIEGGIVTVMNGQCTGILVDNAMNFVQEFIPPYPTKELEKTLLDIQNSLFQYGITGIHEAGIENKEIALFQNLIDQGKWELNTYAMLKSTEKNIAFAKKNGVFQYKNLSIRSFKVFGDGALGSRGALLKKPYSDQHNHFGVLTASPEKMKRIAMVCESTGYQMNTHAIGDSTNKIVLELYKKIYETNKDHRWRIEHAQVVDPADFSLFNKYGVFPSVQPTHAVSDLRWAENRLGKNRMAGAYAYRSILKEAGMLAIGTDFPVEHFDPFLTIHAAVQRMNKDNFPTGGFLNSEAISLEECIKGMTIWAAFSAFQEENLGTLEKGKHATFAIFEHRVTSSDSFRPNFSRMTFIAGKKVYSSL
jgi:predicted amidohydrolase YtcJ